VFGPRQISEHVNNNSSETQYPGSEHGNAKGKVTHHTPPTLRPPAYHAVNLSLTIMGPIEPFPRMGPGAYAAAKERGMNRKAAVKYGSA
jgi:hypothetical protein